MYFLETSAKEAENVERLFMEIAAELMEVKQSITTRLRALFQALYSNDLYFVHHMSSKVVLSSPIWANIESIRSFITASEKQGVTEVRN